jgi:molybdopterin adenylyltransferase
LRIAILTISDRSSRGQRQDQSGPEIARFAGVQGWQVEQTAVVSDDQAGIEQILADWADSSQFDVIFTSGGTGFSKRDRAPEATLVVVERIAPGLVEAIRAESLTMTPHAMLSRAAAGIRGDTIIVNLPGSPRAVVESLQVIAQVLPHAVAVLRDSEDAEEGHTGSLSENTA